MTLPQGENLIRLQTPVCVATAERPQLVGFPAGVVYRIAEFWKWVPGAC